MNSIFTDVRWPNEEAFDYMLMIWKQIGHKITNQILKTIKNSQLKIPLVDEVSFSPDWTTMSDWVVLTNIISKYDQTGRCDQEEKLISITGRLNIICGLSVKQPSFRFDLNIDSKKLYFNILFIKNILEYIKDIREQNIPIIDSEMFNVPIVTSNDFFSMSKETRSTVMAGFKTLGFGKTESMELVEKVINSEKYKDGMEAGEIVTLGLMLSRSLSQ